MKEELKVMENGTSTLADLRQGQGINTDSGPTWLRQGQAPGQWKEIKDITAIRLERIRLGKSMLVENSQQYTSG